MDLGWDPNMLTGLAVGSRRVDRLVDSLNVLNHFGIPMQLAVVAGKDEKLFHELSEMEWHIPVKLYEYVQNVPTFMKAADFIICKAGGLIVTESLASGLPLMLIDVIPGQETGNADYVVQNEAGDLAREPMEVLETMSHWMLDGGKVLRQRAENARRLGRPNAAFQVAGAVWEAALHYSARTRASHGTGRLRLIDLLSRNHVSWEEDSSTNSRTE
jgi:1,2-diacylglycerol 3-beta-galactosyltransferase